MKIGFKGQEELVSCVTTTLTHEEFPRSWNVTVPPGFANLDDLAQSFETAIRSLRPEHPVAILSADMVGDRFRYGQELQRGWSRNRQINGNGDSEHLLEALLASLTPQSPGIQIVLRFEKIVSKMDDSILGLLRDAERVHSLRTITISSYPYHELRERWRSEDHFFCGSDYGDTHECRSVEPLKYCDILKLNGQKGLPEEVIGFLYSLTGGYPQPFNEAVAKWFCDGRREFTAEYRNEMRCYIDPMLQRMLEWLDRKNANFFRRKLAELYAGIESEAAHGVLMSHPWHSVLLSGGKVRSECLGRVALERDTYALGLEKGGWERLRRLYALGNFQSVVRLLEDRAAKKPPLHFQVLYTQAKLMSQLDATSPDHGIELNYRQLRDELSGAIKLVSSNQAQLLDAQLLLERYTQLEVFVNALLATEPSGLRTVDSLVSSRNNADARVGIVLLLSQIEAARRIPGNTVAVQVALPLPEQAFRIWALLRLGVDYYRAPFKETKIWGCAIGEWKRLRGNELVGFEPGKPFANFTVFAFYCLAVHLCNGGNPSDAVEPSFDDLNNSLRKMGYRNTAAHSLAMIPGTRRDEYFVLLDRWADHVVKCLPESSRKELLSVIEPLPIVDEQGLFLAASGST